MASAAGQWGEVGKRLERIAGAVERGARRAEDQIVAGIADKARANAPVLTGALRESIQAVDGGVTVGTDHAEIIEEGSPEGRTEGVHYLRRAAAEVLPKVRPITIDAVSAEVRAEVAKMRGAKGR